MVCLPFTFTAYGLLLQQLLGLGDRDMPGPHSCSVLGLMVQHCAWEKAEFYSNAGGRPGELSGLEGSEG